MAAVSSRRNADVASYKILFFLTLAPFIGAVLTDSLALALILIIYLVVFLPVALHTQFRAASLSSFNGYQLLSWRFWINVGNGLKGGLYNLASSAREALRWTFSSLWNISVLAFYLVSAPVICLVFCGVPGLHYFYISIEGIRVTVNQIVFLSLSELWLIPKGHLSSLYYLLFYTVLAYLHRALVTRQWSQNIYASNIREFMKLTTWFIAVRLGKGVAMAFVLIIFTMHFNDLEPNVPFIATTFIYFLVTQKKWSGDELIIKFVQQLNIDFLEDEEQFMVPYTIKFLPVVTSAMLLMRMCQDFPVACLLGAYTNLVVPLVVLHSEYNSHYIENQSSISKYRRAHIKDITESPTCAVCLDEILRGRVTPCGHIYHSSCLRRCLSISNLCPLCKQTI